MRLGNRVSRLRCFVAGATVSKTGGPGEALCTFSGAFIIKHLAEHPAKATLRIRGMDLVKMSKKHFSDGVAGGLGEESSGILVPADGVHLF